MHARTLALACAGAVCAPAAAAHAAELPLPPAPVAGLQPDLSGHASTRSQMRVHKRELTRDRLERIAWRLERRAARLQDRSPSRAALRDDSITELRATIRRLKRTLRSERRERSFEKVAVPGVLSSIAACESGGNPQAIGGGGAFRGKYQFTLSTWAAVGGSGDPAQASEAEQDMRAAKLYAQQGASPWPVCGR